MIAFNADRKSGRKQAARSILRRAAVRGRSAPWHSGFLAILPRIIGLARWAFRHWSADLREECVQEVVVNCMAAYRRLFYRRQLQRALPSPLARFAIRQVRSGRQVGTKLNVRDVSSQYAQIRKGFRLDRLDHYDEEAGEWREIVIPDNRYPVSDCVAFRIDYPAWVRRFTRRDQRMIAALARSERTQDVAEKFDISPGRVSQKRMEYCEDWHLFQANA
jgi:hypothetical protein